MPRRRLSVAQTIANIFGVPVPVAKGALSVATHSNKHRTAVYSQLGQPLEVSTVSRRRGPRKYKKRVKSSLKSSLKDAYIPAITSRRKSPVSETLGGRSHKNLFSNSKAMPYRRPRRYKRPRFGRRRTIRRRRLTPLALPQSKVVRMRLVIPYTITSSNGTIAMAPIKANSLNDPTGSMSASLPLGLDQWAGQYKKYIVLGSKLKIKSTPTTQTGPSMVGVYLADNNTALTSANHYRSLPGCKVRIVTTNHDLVTTTMTYSGKKFWKLSGIKDDSEQEGDFSTTPGDPTDIAYWHFFCQDMTGGSTFVSDNWIEIEYVVLLTNPVTLAESAL